MGHVVKLGAALLLVTAVASASGQAPDPAPLIAAQREAMKPLARMNGIWRIGAFLGGTLKLIEGRGYDANGNVAFNAFGIVSFNPATQSYSMRSYAHGRQGDFAFKPTEDGYTWDVPAGPGAIIRYTARIAGNRLQEVGDRIAGDSAPTRVFEMALERIGETDWPEAGAVSAR